MTMAYTCDGCGIAGEPRGKGKALPAGWVCVVVAGLVRDLCLACEMRRRAAKDGE